MPKKHARRCLERIHACVTAASEHSTTKHITMEHIPGSAEQELSVGSFLSEGTIVFKAPTHVAKQRILQTMCTTA